MSSKPHMPEFYDDEDIKEYLIKYREIKGDCWIWTKGKSSSGYGTIYINGVEYLVHRLAYELFVDKDIKDVIAHVCDVKLCFNPEHLRNWTQKQNLQDAYNKGRMRSENANGNKTYCKRGHEFTSQNTYIDKKNRRTCRICKRIYRSDR